MENTPDKIQAGLVPYLEEDTGVNGAENQVATNGSEPHANGHNSNGSGFLISEFQRSRERDFDILNKALELGAEFFEASKGKNIGRKEYQSLHSNEWVEYDIGEVLRVFQDDPDEDYDGWAVFQVDSQDRYKDHQNSIQAEKEKLLKTISEERNSGSLPARLFAKLDKIVTLEKPLTNKYNGKEYVIPDTGVITDEEVPDEDKIIRYIRYKLAKDLLDDKGIDEAKLLGLTLELTLADSSDDKGRISKTYPEKLIDLVSANDKSAASKDRRTDAKSAIEQAANYAGWFNYIFPRIRQEHLNILLDDSKKVRKQNAVLDISKEVEELEFREPPASTNNFSLVGVSKKLLHDVPPHYFDLSKGIVIEEQFLQVYQNSALGNQNIHNLGELLLRSDLISKPEKQKREPLSSWPEEKCIKFGRFINGIVQTHLNVNSPTFTRHVLSRAHTLGLAPGVWALRERFGSFSRFYAEIGASNTHRMKNFDNWTAEDFASYLIQVKALNNGQRPSRDVVDKLAKENPNNPSHDVMYAKMRGKGGYHKLLEMAGVFVVERASNQDLVNWGVKFMRANNGNLPTLRALDFLSIKQVGPSSRAIQLRFDSLSAFKESVEEAFIIEKESPETISIDNNPEITTEELRLNEEFEKFRQEIEARDKARKARKKVQLAIAA
jgi:hypothetical protein